MAAVLAEDLHHQVGEAVHHLGLGAESLRGIDHAQDLYHSLHLVEAPEKAPRRAQQAETDLARDLVAFIDGEVPPQLAPRGRAAVLFRAVAGKKEEISD